MPKAGTDQLPKILRIFRNFFWGQKRKSALRFFQDISKRSQPQPNLPLGPSSKLHNNYYSDRDARRDIDYPEEIVGSKAEQLKLLKLTDKWERCEVKKKGDAVKIVPGKVYHWDKIVD